MADVSKFHPGILIKCPSCGGEVPASQLDPESDRPFRCDACKTSALAYASRINENFAEIGAKREKRKQPDHNIPDTAAKARGTPGGN